MRTSIRTKFTIAMIFLFIIILVLFIFSTIYLNKMSNKTNEILKENYLSVVYAREMTEGIMIINQEFINSFLSNKNPDSLKISKELSVIDKTLELEKNNITAPGEGDLVSGIETDYSEYRDTVVKFTNKQQSADNVLYLQNKSGYLYDQLMLLSEINGKSIEVKTDDAKVFAKKAVIQMSLLGSLCFLIAVGFIFSFATYFNERLHQLHIGIRELASSNYSQRLYFNGEDEFSEMALALNEMAEKLSKKIQNVPFSIKEESENETSLRDVQGLKDILAQMRAMEEQVRVLISKFKSE